MSDSEDQINYQVLWRAAEKLVSPQPVLRDEGLDYLFNEGVFSNSPLAAFLLATRITDDDLEVRFHAIQYLGSLLDFEGSKNGVFTDQPLKYVHSYLLGFGENQIAQMLEVAEAYFSAENAIVNILKICSYAGILLSGIVNDRKKPPYLRRKAVYFSGEIGLVEMVPVLENLILRIEKNRTRPDRALSSSLKKEEEELYTEAVVALDKMKSDLAIGKTKS